MALHATCPANPEGHTTFITTAHMVEEWKVTADGTWIETTASLEIAHGPDSGNSWECAECHAEATVVST